MEDNHPCKPRNSFFKNAFDDKKHIFEIVGFFGIVTGLSLQINEDSGLIGWRSLQAASLLLFIISIYWLINEFGEIISDEFERHKKAEGFWKDEVCFLQVLLRIPLNLFFTYIFYSFYLNNYKSEFVKIFHIAFFPLLILALLITRKMIQGTIRDDQPLILAMIGLIFTCILYFSLTLGFTVQPLIGVVSSSAVTLLLILLSWHAVKPTLGIVASIMILGACIHFTRSHSEATTTVFPSSREWTSANACLQQL